MASRSVIDTRCSMCGSRPDRVHYCNDLRLDARMVLCTDCFHIIHGKGG